MIDWIPRLPSKLLLLLQRTFYSTFRVKKKRSHRIKKIKKRDRSVIIFMSTCLFTFNSVRVADIACFLASIFCYIERIFFLFDPIQRLGILQMIFFLCSWRLSICALLPSFRLPFEGSQWLCVISIQKSSNYKR